MSGKKPKVEEVQSVEHHREDPSNGQRAPRGRSQDGDYKEGYSVERYPFAFALAQVAMGTLRVATGADPELAREAKEQGKFDTAMHRFQEEAERAPPEVIKWLRKMCGPTGLATIAVEGQLTMVLHHQLQHFMETDEVSCWPYCGSVHNG